MNLKQTIYTSSSSSTVMSAVVMLLITYPYMSKELLIVALF